MYLAYYLIHYSFISQLKMKKNITYILSLFIFLVFSAMAQKNIDQTKGLEELIDFIGNKYAPDKRVEVFRIKGKVIEEGILLKGETTSEAAYRELIAKASKITSNLNDSVRLLPDKTLGDEHWGIINNSVADLRAKPAYSSEMVTQVLLGMPVKILEKSGSWRRVQTPEGYIGWMSGSLQTQTREQLNDFLAKPKIIVNKQYALSYSEPNKQSQPVSDIVIGNMLPIVEMQKDFFMIIYPDGREAFVQKQDAQKAEDWLNEIKLTGESIVETAKQLMGVPYVWGGTSAKGLDCSGFTKTVYWLHGIIIARDASQQVKNGIEIDSTGNFNNAQKGDLVFFGEKATSENPKERVVHVGIYMGNKEFIHASDYIHINSFDPESPIYDEYNTKRYLRTKRLIGSENTPGIESVQHHPFYQPQ